MGGILTGRRRWWRDFDRDGRPELIVAVGDDSTELYINVFKYEPPRKPAADPGKLADQIEAAWSCGHADNFQPILRDSRICGDWI